MGPTQTPPPPCVLSPYKQSWIDACYHKHDTIREFVLHLHTTHCRHFSVKLRWAHDYPSVCLVTPNPDLHGDEPGQWHKSYANFVQQKNFGTDFKTRSPHPRVPSCTQNALHVPIVCSPAWICPLPLIGSARLQYAAGTRLMGQYPSVAHMPVCWLTSMSAAGDEACAHENPPRSWQSRPDERSLQNSRHLADLVEWLPIGPFIRHQHETYTVHRGSCRRALITHLSRHRECQPELPPASANSDVIRWSHVLLSWTWGAAGSY